MNSEFFICRCISNISKCSHCHDSGESWKTADCFSNKQNIHWQIKVHYDDNDKRLYGAANSWGQKSWASSTGVCPRSKKKDHENGRDGLEQDVAHVDFRGYILNLRTKLYLSRFCTKSRQLCLWKGLCAKHLFVVSTTNKQFIDAIRSQWVGECNCHIMSRHLTYF